VKNRIRLLYDGRSKRATRFRYGLLIFDAASILFFLVTATLPLTPWLLAADAVIGLIILLDLLARLWIAPDRLRHLRQFYVIVDIVVLLSLLAAPFAGQGLTMLRLLRALRLVHSYHLLRDLRRDSRLFRRHEDTVVAAVNLLVFIFAMTALVFVMRGQETELSTYVDALYFTVATLTTTGFGDIAMTTPQGRLLAVAIMVVGVGLFLRLARAIFSPAKVRHKCRDCGLLKHDPDAIHCKHCGAELKIETEGMD
jgi:voltage-gated potassium channel